MNHTTCSRVLHGVVSGLCVNVMASLFMMKTFPVNECFAPALHRTSHFFRHCRASARKLRAAPLDNTRRASHVQQHIEMADEEVSQEVLDGVEGVDEVRGAACDRDPLRIRALLRL